MKQSLALIKILGLSCLIGLTACGGKFNAEPQASLQPRPPVTADPLQSEEQRQWEAEENYETLPGRVLETESERESFFNDLLEEKPRYTEDQLAVEAETQYQKNEKKRAEKTEVKAETKKETAAEPVAPTVETPKKEAPKKDEPKPVKPVAPVTKNQFCDDLNVTGGKGEADLSELYNDDEPLPNAMPSAELKNARSDDKKNKFVCILLPIAIRMNEQVYRQRLEVVRLIAKKKQGQLTNDDQKWMDDMKIAYSLEVKATDADLLQRVDIIPLPLLLAQAALESGWGRSRAAGNLNNLFGIHAYGNQPCESQGGACIRKYKSLPEGVAGYIRLLNADRHYDQFRDARNKMRQARQPLDSIKLLENMGKYNESPAKYIQDVREIMTRYNKFTQYVFNEAAVEPESR
jgi:uncharacterized FlgJ-related protein